MNEKDVERIHLRLIFWREGVIDSGGVIDNIDSSGGE
jgi:hypothetical protein